MTQPAPLFREEAVARKRRGEEYHDLLGVTDGFTWELLAAVLILVGLIGG